MQHFNGPLSLEGKIIELNGDLTNLLHSIFVTQLTPAESRTYNKSCMLLKFYDNHDIWHLISAGSMFFSFMVSKTHCAT